MSTKKKTQKEISEEIRSIVSMYDKIFSECFLALYPNGDGKDLKPTDLPMYIKQLRDDKDRLKKLAQDELTKRGEVQRELVSEKNGYENKLENLQMFCDMAEQKAIDFEDKIRVLTLCFNGLFGKEKK